MMASVMKRSLAELIGTFLLVFFGTGAASPFLRPAPASKAVPAGPPHDFTNHPHRPGQVKAYVVRQLQKIHAGGVRVQDFIFATEVRTVCIVCL